MDRGSLSNRRTFLSLTAGGSDTQPEDFGETVRAYRSRVGALLSSVSDGSMATPDFGWSPGIPSDLLLVRVRWTAAPFAPQRSATPAWSTAAVLTR